MSMRIRLIAAAALAATALPALAAQDVTRRASVAADAEIDVSNVQGSVEVTAWDRNEVELIAHLESDKDELEFEATEHEVRIEVERPDRKWGRGDDEEAILKLRVPKGARLSVDTVSAWIRVEGVRGEQRLESVSGEIETQAFDAPVSLASVSGEVKVTGSGGRAFVRTENVSGTTTALDLRGGYEGEAVSGTIDAAIAAAERLRIETVSGDVDVKAELAPEARVEMNSISGTLTLTFRPPVNAEFDIESFSGSIENCFGPKPRDTRRFGPGSELSFTQGRGVARVEIQTLSGDIELCDR